MQGTQSFVILFNLLNKMISLISLKKPSNWNKLLFCQKIKYYGKNLTEIGFNSGYGGVGIQIEEKEIL